MLENGYFRPKLQRYNCSDIITLRSLMIFNPDIEPKMRKPNEEDIQDAKLLYYMPKNKHIEAKRNHVGLAEGLIINLSYFNPSAVIEKPQDPQPDVNLLDSEKMAQNNDEEPDYEIQNHVNYMSVEMDNEVHIAKYFEKKFWIYMVFIVNTDNMEKTVRNDLEYFPREKQIRLIDEFYSSWHLFYGELGNYMDPQTDTFISKFDTIFEEYLISFFHGDWGKK